MDAAAPANTIPGHSDALLAAVMRSSLDGIVVVDDRSCVVEFNPAAEAMFGHARADVLGRPIGEVIVPPDLRAAHTDGFARYLAGGEPRVLGRRIEVRAQRRDGTVFPVELAITETAGPTGRLFTACLRDLTAERARDAALRESEARLASFLEHAPVGMFVRRLSGEYEVVNATMLAGLGLEAADALGRAYDEVAGKEVVAETMATERVILETGRPHVAEVVYPTATGPRETLAVRFPLRDADGRITHIGGVLVDIADQKRTERRLRESEARLLSFMEHAPVGMYVTEPDGRYAMVNASILTSLGKSADEVVGRPYWETLGLATKQVAEAAKQVVLDTGRPHVSEAVFPSLRGPRATLVVRFPLHDDDGRVTQIGGVVVDITDQKRVEAQLRESEGRFAAFLRHAPASMYLKDGDGRYLMVNEHAARHFGARPEDMLGRTIRDMAYPSLADATEAAERAVLKAGRAATSYESANPTPTSAHALVTRFPVPDADGRLTRLGGMLIDITELKEAEERLRESERRFRLLSELHPVPVIFLRLSDMAVVLANPAFHAMTRSPDGDLSRITGENCLHDPDERARVYAALQSDESSDLEWHMRRFDGTDFYAAVSSRRFEMGGEAIAVSSFVDLTDRKRAEAELERSREALFQSEKLSALGSMLAGVSHELNNPLAVVVGQSIILEEDAAGTSAGEAATEIRVAAERCSRIVQTFLAMARQKPPEFRAVTASVLLDAALELAAYGLRGTRVAVRRDYAPDLPPLWADSDQLHQVVMNLVVNAQQALAEIPGERVLAVRARIGDRRARVWVEVSDNGPGIPAEVARRVFEPFYTTKPLGAGTGIGLSFSRGVVEAHGGTLTLVPGGRGATFRIDLPAANAAAVELVDGGGAEEVLEPARLRALVVDDEPGLARTLAKFVEREGYEVDVAVGGRAAQERLREGCYNAILSDVRMPDLDGPGLFAWLSAERPELVGRVAFVTGDTLGPGAARFLDAAGRPRLEKPFSREGVRDLLAELTAQAS